MPSVRHSGRNDGVAVLEVTRGHRQPLGAEVRNMVVQQVEHGSPAWTAGICKGMTIQEVNGDRVTSVRELSRAVRDAGSSFTLTMANTSSVGYMLRSQPVRHPVLPVQDPPKRHGGNEATTYTPSMHETPPRSRLSHSELSYTPTSQELMCQRGRSSSVTSSSLRRYPQEASPELLETLDWGSTHSPPTPSSPLSVTHGRVKLISARLRSPGKRRFTQYYETRKNIPLSNIEKEVPGRRQIPQGYHSGELTQRLVAGDDMVAPYVRTRAHVHGPVDELDKEEPPMRRVNRTNLERSSEPDDSVHFQKRYIPQDATSYTPTTDEVLKQHGYPRSISGSPIRRCPPSASPELLDCLTYEPCVV
eukprot:TRINITY_DN10297_c0_g1_i1.p1 TRINITY_DN10297_c0_g1~~TRINITY_DN10297_c0_g1_i1.p1  ORF type:complete len:361 (+),score=33.23 TRINITY_DN10297_c0_g1_i1:107-1189(+)